MIQVKFWRGNITLTIFAIMTGATLVIVSLFSAGRVSQTTVSKPVPVVTSLESIIVSNKNNDSQPPNNTAYQPSSSTLLIKPELISSPTPSTVLDLTNWKLTLPVETSQAGNPDEIKQPQLGSFAQSPYFELNGQKNGVVFRADVDGATTKNSAYPRSELREMTNFGKEPAAWSSSSGTHTMVIKQAITHLPDVKPEVVAGQIHDASDDVIMVRLEGKQLFVESNGQVIGELDPNYNLGTVFSVKIVSGGGRIKVYYNNVQKVDYAKSGQGYYFKAGCYTQSNLSKGDQPGAYGEVVIYDLQVSHQ